MVKIVWIGENSPPCLGEPEGIYYVDPFKEYRIVEKLKSDLPREDYTTFEDIDKQEYVYITEEIWQVRKKYMIKVTI